MDPGIGLPDPLVELQRSATRNNDRVFTTPALNFGGQGFTGVSPPDPVGDVGLDYYIQSVNGGGGALVQIYDKTGTTVGLSGSPWIPWAPDRVDPDMATRSSSMIALPNDG